MMMSLDLPYKEGMNYGVGVNLLTGEILGKGVKPGEPTSLQDAGGHEAGDNVTLIREAEDLYDSLGISVRASGHYGLFSSGGKFRFSEQVKYNSQSTFLLARSIVTKAFKQIEEAQLEEQAVRLLEQGKFDQFRESYGDAFVRGIKTGGEFFSVISITSVNREEQQKLAIKLRAAYSGISGSLNLDEQTRSALSRAELHIVMYQEGGTGEDLSFTDNPDNVMQRLHDFPGIVDRNPIPYFVQVASYKTLDNYPEVPGLRDIQSQSDALERYATLRLKLLTHKNDVEFIQHYPGYYENPPDVNTLNAWQEFFSEQLNKLEAQAKRCASAPVDGCRDFPFQLPLGFRIPERETGVEPVPLPPPPLHHLQTRFLN
ncbi:hypothetical protein HYR99_30060 [Candidatus Poribacteria bacterium]|nr:hypothetical protein [Candidatus Poribacteria bacterium]